VKCSSERPDRHRRLLRVHRERHVATAPLPTSAMNSRRLMGLTPRLRSQTDYSRSGMGRGRALQQKAMPYVRDGSLATEAARPFISGSVSKPEVKSPNRWVSAKQQNRTLISIVLRPPFSDR